MRRIHGLMGSAAPIGVAIALCIIATAAWGDSFNAPAPPGDPASARYTLETIYNRLDTGAQGAPSVYSDPTSGPGKTGRSVGEIMGAAPATNANAALRSQVLIGRMFWSLHPGAWGLTNGTMANVGAQNITPGTAAQAILQGYHDGTGEVEGDADLAADNIKAGVTIFGVGGSVVESTGDATAAQVLAGATFSKAGEAGLTGTMPNRGAQNITPGTAAQAILQGYHDGMGSVAGDADLTAANIKAGVSIFGVDGTVVESTGDAVVGQVLAGATFSKAGEAGLTGTMANQGGRGFLPGATNLAIPAGYHDGSGVVTGDAALVTGNVRAGVTIFGVTGKPQVVDSSSGNATASDILAGRKAWVGGQEVTGTRPYAPVPRTGQTNSYFAGDDGDLMVGLSCPEPRFTTNLNATVVRDNLTGLEWLRNANAAGALNWTNALLSCKGLVVTSVWAESTVTNSDWRLPNLRELQSLIDYEHNNPAMPLEHPFLNVQSVHYWSSSTRSTDSTNSAWVVGFGGGGLLFESKTNTINVWPVRGGGATPPPPADMVLIPAGDFVKTSHPDGSYWVTNHISAFYMGRHHVTKALWDEVYGWATNNGYAFDRAGSGKAADHPVHTVMWYDVVKWCNARSEMEGRPPAYYTDAGHTTVYRTGRVDVANAWVRWDTGYRLPTESEWEKAARGGVEAQRFPWGATISHTQANFQNIGGEAYQYGTTGYHPDWDDGVSTRTSPVGSFAANGYGLYDMAGNVWGWCWDWSVAPGSYYVAGSDLRGPDTGSHRVFRGGSWFYYASYCRSAYRGYDYPTSAYDDLGFRVALPPGQQ